VNPNLGVDGCGDVADDEFSFVTQTDRILNTSDAAVESKS